MKLYSYLHSGKLLLATKLPTHTQVLNSRVSMLADPTPEAFSEAMVYLMCDQRLRPSLDRQAKNSLRKVIAIPVFAAKFLACLIP